MSKITAEFITDLENIDQVEVEYNFDEDGHIEITSVDKKTIYGQWHFLIDELNDHTMDSIMERCIEHMPEAQAEHDEYLRDREAGL